MYNTCIPLIIPHINCMGTVYYQQILRLSNHFVHKNGNFLLFVTIAIHEVCFLMFYKKKIINTKNTKLI